MTVPSFPELPPFVLNHTNLGLQGNADYTEWFLESHINLLRDADKVMSACYNLCHLSGPLQCVFYASTPSAIEGYLEALLSRLWKHPIVVVGRLHADNPPELIIYSSLKRMINTSLYRPVFTSPALTKVLTALEEGDGRHFLDLNVWKPFEYNCNNGDLPANPPETEEGNDEVFKTVLCTDGLMTHESIAGMEVYMEELIGMSKATGAVKVNSKISCAGWTIEPKWSFNGIKHPSFVGTWTGPYFRLRSLYRQTQATQYSISPIKQITSRLLSARETTRKDSPTPHS